MAAMQERFEQVAAMRGTGDFSVWTMIGGSLTSFFGVIGSQDVVAGVGVICALGALITNALHKRATRKMTERIEYSKLTKEQQETYDKL